MVKDNANEDEDSDSSDDDGEEPFAFVAKEEEILQRHLAEGGTDVGLIVDTTGEPDNSEDTSKYPEVILKSALTAPSIEVVAGAFLVERAASKSPDGLAREILDEVTARKSPDPVVVVKEEIPEEEEEEVIQDAFLAEPALAQGSDVISASSDLVSLEIVDLDKQSAGESSNDDRTQETEEVSVEEPEPVPTTDDLIGEIDKALESETEHNFEEEFQPTEEQVHILYHT